MNRDSQCEVTFDECHDELVVDDQFQIVGWERQGRYVVVLVRDRET